MIVEAARRGRNAAYRLASPADRLWRRLSGRNPLPPLWLRRHTGAVGRFESAARDTAAFLDGLGLVEPDFRVLDVGCGAGAMVPEFSRRLGPEGRYVGFDVHEPSIRWCRAHYAGDRRLTFDLARIASAYGERFGPPAADYRFPVEDGQADLVLAKSVFTHLLPADAAHYLAEIRRVLRPGRAAVVTAFLFDARGAALDLVRRALPCEDERGNVRWRLRSRPTAAVAYAKTSYFPGADRLRGQDTLLLGL
jgi:SAM-dependent methyltransferase